MKEKDNNKKELINNFNKVLKVLYVILMLLLVLIIMLLFKELKIISFITKIIKVLSPLFIGFIIAWLLNPLSKRLQKKGLNKAASGVVVFVILMFFIVLFLRLLIPTLYNQLNDLIQLLPSVVSEIKNIILNFFDKFSSLELSDIKLEVISQFEKGITSLLSNFPSFLIKHTISFFSKIGTVVLGLLIGLYMLIDFDSVSKIVYKLIPKKAVRKFEEFLNIVETDLRKYVNSLLFISFIVFLGSSLGFLLIGLKAPLLFGLICGVLDLIPYIGPYIGGLAAATVGFTQSPLIGILTLVVVLIVQNVENMIIQPLVVGKTLKLHPVVISIGLLVFGHFFGIVGMIFATPIITVLKIIYQFLKGKIKIFDKAVF